MAERPLKEVALGRMISIKDDHYLPVCASQCSIVARLWRVYGPYALNSQPPAV